MQITITEAPQKLELPIGCKILEIHNTGSEIIYRGWEPTTVATGGANQGVPLAADKAIIYGGHGVPLNSGSLVLVCAAGKTSTLNYSFKKS